MYGSVVVSILHTVASGDCDMAVKVLNLHLGWCRVDPLPVDTSLLSS